MCRTWTWMASAALALAGALGAPGCGSSDGFDPWPTARPLGKDIPVPRAGSAAGAAHAGAKAETPPVVEPTDMLTLRQALALALWADPTLKAAAWEITAAQARARQEGAWPNPEVRFTMGDFGGSGKFEGSQNSDQTIRFSQVIDLADKPSKRRQVAQWEAAQAGWDYEARRLDVLADTAKAFLAVLAAQERLAAAEEWHKASTPIVETAIRRAKEGTLRSLDAAKAQLDQAASNTAVVRARREREVCRGVLAACWGADRPRFRMAAGRLDDLPGVPPLEVLLPAVDESPKVARWEAEARRREAALELARARQIPDVRIFAGARRTDDTQDHGYLLGVEVPLPVFDRNEAGVEEARAKRLKTAYEKQSAAMDARVLLRETHRDMAAEYDEAVGLRDELLPALHKILAITRDSFDGRTVTELDVLKAYRDVATARGRQIQTLLLYHTGLVDIERRVARPVESLMAPTSRTSANSAEPPAGAATQPAAPATTRPAAVASRPAQSPPAGPATQPAGPAAR